MKKIFVISNLVSVSAFVFMLSNFIGYMIGEVVWGFNHFGWVFSVALVAQIFNIFGVVFQLQIKIYRKILWIILHLGVAGIYASLLMAYQGNEEMASLLFFGGLIAIVIFLILEIIPELLVDL